MRQKANITSYKNFWLIWLNSAGSREGSSLFKIQTDWDIRTNYLYHNESGLNRPLFISMIKGGYLEKEGKRLKALFGWIPDFIERIYPSMNYAPNFWMPNNLLNAKWNVVQKFIEDNHHLVFDQNALKILFRNNREILGRYGMNAFSLVFMYVMFNNFKIFTSKYSAGIVLRMISTELSLTSELDVINYMQRLNVNLGKVKIPYIAGNENELSRILCPLKW